MHFTVRTIFLWTGKNPFSVAPMSPASFIKKNHFNGHWEIAGGNCGLPASNAGCSVTGRKRKMEWSSQAIKIIRR